MKIFLYLGYCYGWKTYYAKDQHGALVPENVHLFILNMKINWQFFFSLVKGKQTKIIMQNGDPFEMFLFYLFFLIKHQNHFTFLLSLGCVLNINIHVMAPMVFNCFALLLLFYLFIFTYFIFFAWLKYVINSKIKYLIYFHFYSNILTKILGKAFIILIMLTKNA